MIRILVTLIGIMLSISVPAATAAENGPKEPAYLYRAKVIKVVDGDTIDVDIDLGFYIELKSQRIRLVGIDAPEPRGASREEGKEASKYLRDRISGKTIILRTIKGRDDADRDDSFGRWLGIVYLNGIDINQEMIDVGHAEEYNRN